MLVAGTYFFSKRPLGHRYGVCAACKRVTRVDVFEAFEWGHLYFIPIIPGGRVHVRQCSGCHRFSRVRLKKWEADRQAALERARQLMRGADAPGPFAAAFELVALYDLQEAARLAVRLERDYPDDPSVRAQLAAWHLGQGDAQGAERFAPRPTDAGDPAAVPTDDAVRRRRMAIAIAANDLATTVKELFSIARPEAQPDLYFAFTAATGLKKAGQLKDAYALCEHLFRHFPRESGKHHGVFTLTRTLEKELGISPSLVPKGAGRGDKLIPVGIAVAAVVLAMVANAFLTRFQTLFVDNATASGATVTVDAQALHLAAHTRQALDIAEGPHAVSVQLDDGRRYEKTIVVQNGLLERFSRHNAFVFDVLGAELLELFPVVYAEVPAPRDDDPRPQYFAGHDFYAFHQVDYAFTQPPESLSLNQGERRILFALDEPPVHPAKVLASARMRHPPISPDTVLAFGEGQLKGGERDPDFLEALAALCEVKGCTEETSQLLRRLAVGESAP